MSTGPTGELRRLRELDAAPGGVEDEAKALLRVAERHLPAVGSKARVRAALLQRRGGTAMLVLRPFVIVSLLVLVTGATAAGTTLGRRWLDEGYRRLVAARTRVGMLTGSPAPVVTPAPVQVSQVPAPAEAAPQLVAPATETPTPHRRPELREDRAHRATRPEAETRPAAKAALDDDDPQVVASAVRALRRDHDAARASALLDTYVRRWPNGALVEEAMALAIEAAQARGGDGDVEARARATRYLHRFPAGRFGDTAHRALARPAP
jgi:hypothetical protein